MFYKPKKLTRPKNENYGYITKIFELIIILQASKAISPKKKKLEWKKKKKRKT